MGATCSGVPRSCEEIAEAVLGDEADVLGEHGEEAAHEEAGDAVGGVALRLEGEAEGGEAAGDLSGDAGGGAGGVERVGVGPDEGEAVADGGVGEVVEADAEAGGVGEVGVVLAGAGEVGEELDILADGDGDQEGRVLVGEGTGVGFGLAAGADHRVVPGRASGRRAGAPGRSGSCAGGVGSAPRLASRTKWPRL